MKFVEGGTAYTKILSLMAIMLSLLGTFIISSTHDVRAEKKLYFLIPAEFCPSHAKTAHNYNIHNLRTILSSCDSARPALAAAQEMLRNAMNKSCYNHSEWNVSEVIAFYRGILKSAQEKVRACEMRDQPSPETNVKPDGGRGNEEPQRSAGCQVSLAGDSSEKCINKDGEKLDCKCVGVRNDCPYRVVVRFEMRSENKWVGNSIQLDKMMPGKLCAYASFPRDIRYLTYCPFPGFPKSNQPKPIGKVRCDFD